MQVRTLPPALVFDSDSAVSKTRRRQRMSEVTLTLAGVATTLAGVAQLAEAVSPVNFFGALQPR